MKPEHTPHSNPSLDDLCELYKDLTGKEVDPEERRRMQAVLRQREIDGENNGGKTEAEVYPPGEAGGG